MSLRTKMGKHRYPAAPTDEMQRYVDELKRCFDSGQIARESGKTEADCPFTNEERRQEWLRGFSEQKSLAPGGGARREGG